MRGIVPDGYRECHNCGLFTSRPVCRCGTSVGGQTQPIEHHPLSRGRQAEPPLKTSESVPARKAPNKTEALYRDKHLVGVDARYEALTLRMANSHRYTPDWVVVRGGRVECHEVKGSYRLHSHQRARLAFDQAMVEFPFFVFVWAELNQNREWNIEVKNA